MSGPIGAMSGPIGAVSGPIELRAASSSPRTGLGVGNGPIGPISHRPTPPAIYDASRLFQGRIESGRGHTPTLGSARVAPATAGAAVLESPPSRPVLRRPLCDRNGPPSWH